MDGLGTCIFLSCSVFVRSVGRGVLCDTRTNLTYEVTSSAHAWPHHTLRTLSTNPYRAWPYYDVPVGKGFETPRKHVYSTFKRKFCPDFRSLGLDKPREEMSLLAPRRVQLDWTHSIPWCEGSIRIGQVPNPGTAACDFCLKLNETLPPVNKYFIQNFSLKLCRPKILPGDCKPADKYPYPYINVPTYFRPPTPYYTYMYRCQCYTGYTKNLARLSDMGKSCSSLKSNTSLCLKTKGYEQFVNASDDIGMPYVFSYCLSNKPTRNH
ncbi:hypothetical protein EVAR_82067_1 [Eumeta japonica]|uniref:Uncharacterized protein n=1 Tax=Eumeta variegata TaxID=151549 RepID=A0A4C1U2A9_EUMVA|nr:hypothetical protein EVAR_82067_1 [Eumeta japonica]